MESRGPRLLLPLVVTMGVLGSLALLAAWFVARLMHYRVPD
jgi:hypothetical protein